VIGAEDGLAGAESAFHILPDLIICDITMPRLDGHGVLLQLRANQATADIPFIFVTARASYEDIRTGMDLGADDYISKPFTRQELLRAVRTRLEKKATLEHKQQEEVNQWQQAFEQEREQRLLKSKLVAMFSHDFRNPLTTILSSNSLLRDYADRLDEKRRLVYFNRVEAGVRQLLQMLDDMLVVAQMENGTLDFKPELLDIGKFVETIVEEFRAIHNETYHIVYDNQLPDAVLTDPRLLRQIAANLISNAIKYSPQGSEVRVLLEQHEKYCVLTVQDQGIGIPEEDQARLFNAFQRASNVGAVRGTGLGLAIVKRAVDLHGGSIDLESQIGVGTTITVRLPL
jgi:two-component system sensor histidine kinase/response regulator